MFFFLHCIQNYPSADNIIPIFVFPVPSTVLTLGEENILNLIHLRQSCKYASAEKK